MAIDQPRVSTVKPGDPPTALEEIQDGMVSIEMEPPMLQMTPTLMPLDGQSATLAPPSLPTLTPQAPAATEGTERRSYWRRRLDLWDTVDEEEAAAEAAARTASRTTSRVYTGPKFEAGSISSLPIAVQVGFRRKMLGIFAFQLLLLTICMIVITYVPAIRDIMYSAFAEPLYILVALAVMIAFLGFLYLAHATFPLNWLILVLFTVSLAVFFGSIQVLLDTNAGLFCCAFTFFAMVLMVGLSGVVRRNGNKTVLLSSGIAGFVSFAIVTTAAAILFGIWQTDFISTGGLGYSILLEFVLIMWFSYDASTMYALISPDEYMNGVIYFYTDLIVLAVISLFFGAIIIFCSACGTASGFGYCDFYACMHSRGDDGGDIEGEVEAPVELTIPEQEMER